MFSIGGTELLIIFIFAFLIFGPDKLPRIGRVVGRAIRSFRAAQSEAETFMREEIYDPDKDVEPVGDLFARIFSDDDDDDGGVDGAHADAGSSAARADGVTPARETPRDETFAERKARVDAQREQRRQQRMGAAAPADKQPESTSSREGQDAARPV